LIAMRLRLLRRMGLAPVARWLNRARKRQYWERAWGRDDYAPPWLGRGVAAEVIDAVRDGWFPRGGAALDIGCGQGEMVHWLAEQGYEAVGVDISEAAVARARSLASGRAEFRRADICARTSAAAIERARYNVLIDRGCFHQIAEDDDAAYRDAVIRAAAPNARFILLMMTTRGVAPDDARAIAADRARIAERVERTLGGAFAIERIADTALDNECGRVAERCLPGLAFWMTRRPAP